MDREAWRATVHRIAELDTTEYRQTEKERTWESSLALEEEMSRRFYCPDFTAAGKRDELEKRTIKQNL